MQLILYTAGLLGLLGLFGALLLYFTAKKFRTTENPLVDEVEHALPSANCGGCGFSGCRAFAAECVRKGNLDGMRCTASGQETQAAIAAILGCAPGEDSMRRIAVLRCAGCKTLRPVRYNYDGARSCAVTDAAGVGPQGCAFGCLGCGDCVQVCERGALRIDEATGLPVIDTSACFACGKCVAECPRHLLELRPIGRRDRRVWVACANRERGTVARKVCAAACIGCGKCATACPFGAIKISDNLAYIDPDICKACGKCAAVCPTGAIHTSFELPKTGNE